MFDNFSPKVVGKVSHFQLFCILVGTFSLYLKKESDCHGFKVTNKHCFFRFRKFSKRKENKKLHKVKDKQTRKIKAQRVERRKSRVTCATLSSCKFFPRGNFFVQGRFFKILDFCHKNSVKLQNYIPTYSTLIKVYPILLL